MYVSYVCVLCMYVFVVRVCVMQVMDVFQFCMEVCMLCTRVRYVFKLCYVMYVCMLFMCVWVAFVLYGRIACMYVCYVGRLSMYARKVVYVCMFCL